MVANHIILTGAGFSKNFGCPIASEFKSFLLAKIKSDPQLHSECIKFNNFEDAYVSIQKGQFSNQQKSNFHMATINAFSTHLNNCFKSKDFGQAPYRIVDDLIVPLCLNKDSAYFFTLNQDLFIENKALIQDPIFNHLIPGIIYDPTPSSDPPFPELRFMRKVIIDSSCVENAKRDIQSFKKSATKNLIYVKLHGSSNWFSSNNSKEILVIGSDKKGAISKEPLLQYYFDVFKNELHKDNSKILIIGYGFCDEHINESLREAQRKNNLEIHLMYHDNSIEQKVRQESLKWHGFYNFYQAFLDESYTTEPPEYTRLKNDFFDR